MKTKPPKVSVIMPIYNAEKYVGEAIRSILRQTFKDFEFLILNDGSRDQSLHVIESFKDSRIILINHKTNKGLVAILNQGLKLARGQYIARMDADDVSYPKRLATQIKFLEQHPHIAAVGSWVKTMGIEKNRGWQYRTDPTILECELLFDAPLAHPSAMLRSATLRKHNLIYRIKHAEDYGLWNDIAQHAHLSNIPRYLLHYRVHPQQTGAIQSTIRTRAAQSLRNAIVRHLVPKANLKELALHQQIATRSFDPSLKFISQTERWLLKIKKRNSQKNIYQANALNKVLGFYWWQVCQSNTKQGTSILKIYKNSKLVTDYNPNSVNRLKFWIKCCLRQ
jgi:glycosyltransferase involved in cell wall biosynthesis